MHTLARALAPRHVIRVTKASLAVQALHTAGVSHRSLAPSKVLITSDFRLKVAGAGQAPALHASLGDTSRGDPGYLAPEGAHLPHMSLRVWGHLCV